MPQPHNLFFFFFFFLYELVYIVVQNSVGPQSRWASTCNLLWLLWAPILPQIYSQFHWFFLCKIYINIYFIDSHTFFFFLFFLFMLRNDPFYLNPHIPSYFTPDMKYVTFKNFNGFKAHINHTKSIFLCVLLLKGTLMSEWIVSSNANNFQYFVEDLLVIFLWYIVHIYQTIRIDLQ